MQIEHLRADDVALYDEGRFSANGSIGEQEWGAEGTFGPLDAEDEGEAIFPLILILSAVGSRIRAEGQMDLSSTHPHVDLRLSAKGENLSDVVELAGFPLERLGPYSAVANAVIESKSIFLSGIEARAADVAFAGEATADLTDAKDLRLKLGNFDVSWSRSNGRESTTVLFDRVESQFDVETFSLKSQFAGHLADVEISGNFQVGRSNAEADVGIDISFDSRIGEGQLLFDAGVHPGPSGPVGVAIIKSSAPDASAMLRAIGVRGTISDPKFRPNKASLTIDAAKVAVGTAINPLGILIPFVRSGLGDKNPCVAALEEPSGPSPDRSPKRDGLGGKLLEGLGGAMKGIGGAVDKVLGG
ncbi:MAG: hypothetical protein CL569_20930 [Alphaproteobacteria bacterium]|nr:hypothetical protein [Alphaproteobacteria bacterium]